MPIKSKRDIYKDTVELAKEYFRSGGPSTTVAAVGFVKQIFEILKEINKEEEYPEYK